MLHDLILLLLYLDRDNGVYNAILIRLIKVLPMEFVRHQRTNKNKSDERLTVRIFHFRGQISGAEIRSIEFITKEHDMENAQSPDHTSKL